MKKKTLLFIGGTGFLGQTFFDYINENKLKNINLSKVIIVSRKRKKIKSKIKISDSELSKIINEIFDLKPHSIESRFKLRDPIYLETASYGHMGRKSEKKTKTLNSKYSGVKKIEVELFPWEKLEYVNQLIKTLKL